MNMIINLSIPAWAIFWVLALANFCGTVWLTNCIYDHKYKFQTFQGIAGFFMICAGYYECLLFEYKYIFFANLTLVAGIMFIATSVFVLIMQMHADQPENIRPAGIRFAIGVWMLAIQFPLRQMENTGGFVWGTMAATLFTVFTVLFVAVCVRLTISFYLADKRTLAEKSKKILFEILSCGIL